MSSIVSNKADTGEWNTEVGGTLQHAGVCGCICEQQRNHIHRQSMTFQRHR